MYTLCAFWLPILVSAVFVFLVSFILHTALPWHKSDYKSLPSESAVLDAVRPFNVPPGDYMFPKCESMSDMKSPAFIEKRNRGPVGIMTVFPNGTMSMGTHLAKWFIYIVVVNYIAANIAAHALPAAAGHHREFHTIALAVFLGMGAALCQMSIWYQRSWLTTIKSVIDALVYAIVTGATFVWLWPHA